ncbi:VC0807 family protein [Bacteriovorax sp. DB6_IX]|uniref:VC0807 family protein n=1 Tax=Bacteriovorax sp. DB6_IX TaxID=1353530 RepID=UPI00038A44C1|nr:VC0807 family protein [Bacteriovorax sp. DB6_IX]EQC51991.1 putative membrane protein [Bacteriovorax sp. DB6_IX]
MEKKKKDNGFLNLLMNVVIPSVILVKFSSDKHLGQVYSLIIALAFPLSYGLYDYIKEKKFNFISALGLFSVLLTGGIGLFKLDRNWMIVKETAIPAIIGIIVLGSQKTKYPLFRTILAQIFDLEKIDAEFEKTGHADYFEKKINLSGIWLGFTFFISAILNYVLAVMILKGEPGSVEFNESLGKMTALSFPVISVPMLIMFGIIIYILINAIKKHTSLELDDIVKQ